MNSDLNLKKVLVRDAKLMPHNEAVYQVFQGGLNVTQKQYPVVAPSNNSLTFNIQTPSLSTIMSNRVYITSRIGFVASFASTVAPSLDGSTVNPAWPFNWGSTTAPASFPLQRLFSTSQATINNTNVTLVSQEMLAPLLNMLDPETVQKYSMTPCRVDNYMNYEDGVNYSNSMLASYGDSHGLNEPNGAWKLDDLRMSTDGVTFTAYNSLSTTAQKSVYFAITVTEPLVLSPFVFADTGSAVGGMHQIQTLNFVFNVASNVNRSIRQAYNSASPLITFSLASTSNSPITSQSAFTNTALLIEYITQPKDVILPSKNITPFMDFVRYPTTDGTPFNPQETRTISSSTISVNVVPDKLILYVRKSLGSQTPYDSDYAFKINSCEISWDNDSGILSSSSAQDLYRMSREASFYGSYNDWSGSANLTNATNATTVPTVGSYLVLDMGRHVQLRSGQAVGQVGNYQLSVKLNVTYQQTLNDPNGNARSSFKINPVGVELVILTVTSGFFMNDNGMSTRTLGVLSEQDVNEAYLQEPISSHEVNRMVGTGFFDSLKSAISKGASFLLPKLKQGLRLIPDPRAQAGAELIHSFGYAQKKNLDKRLN